MSHQMLDRVLALLDAVAAAPGIGRRELARAVGLPQPTANRIVTHLLDERLLTEAGGLRLGLRLFELGTRAAAPLVTAAGPYLLDLHAMLGWTIQLGVLDGPAVTYLLKVDARRAPRLRTHVAGRFPVDRTGAGKALLAFSPPEVADAIPAATAIADELRATRRRGYAIDREEFQEGMTGVAVPVGRAVAALTVTGPTGEFDVTRAAHAATVVARLIEARLGGPLEGPPRGPLEGPPRGPLEGPPRGPLRGPAA